MVSKLRKTRIADRIKQELSVLLLEEISDPRLERIFITDVSVDRELAYANIYVSAIEGRERSGDILSGLNHAQGFIRHELSQKIDLRVFPRLRFFWDPTPERADHIERLFATLQLDNVGSSQKERKNSNET